MASPEEIRLRRKKSASADEVRHSLAHLLAAAVLKKYPKTKLGIGPVIENGFYYDFLLGANSADKGGLRGQINESDLPGIEAVMKQIIKEGLDFWGEKLTPAKAKKIFQNQPFKLDLIKEFSKDKKPLTIYYTGKKSPRGPQESANSAFIDLCRGGHVKNTSEINPDAFKLTHLAGAYWRGNEKNPQLTRIYGLAFNTKKELDDHLKMLEEAKKRDHKKLGPELDLFTFSELVGGGLPLWTPKGTIIRDLLDSYVWELRKERGYQRVDIPHITKKDLYEKSGHWEKFKDELFKIQTREGHIFAMKPMNCPHHTQIYARKKWSYRELPQRYASTTKVYRDEQTGELAGLSRVRAITQDDAHVFCRPNQVKNEINKIWDIIETFYRTFGFSLAVRLSLMDPKQPEKYLGSKPTWKKAEQELKELAQKRGAKAAEAPGEAAFYGPKIDFLAKDSLGREWQVATIQLDMNMPERFNLSCANEKGENERIVMIHAAIMGSIERFLAILIEHYAGAFPLWLAPVQIAVIPVSEKHLDYARKVAAELSEYRAIIAEENETLGKKIRNAELQKNPYVLVVGDKEISENAVNVRHYKKGLLGPLPLEKLKEKLNKEIKEKIPL